MLGYLFHFFLLLNSVSESSGTPQCEHVEFYNHVHLRTVFNTLKCVFGGFCHSAF